MNNKKVMIVENNNKVIGRLKYYINEYFNHSIDILVVEDLQECIKHLSSYDVVFINDALGASYVLLYISNNKLKVEVIVTSNNPEHYDIYKGKASSFILSPYGYKDVVNAFNKAFNRFNENTSLLLDPTKCFIDFEKHPKIHYEMNKAKEELKVYLKEKFNVDYVGIEILDRNNEYYFSQNDHDKWHKVCNEFALSNKRFSDNFSSKQFLRMKSEKSNHYFNMTRWNKYDLRAQTIGERKNGVYIFIYDEECDVKHMFTITFKEANIDVDKLDKKIVEAITHEIRNSEYLNIARSVFSSKIASYKRSISLDRPNISRQYISDLMFDYKNDILLSKPPSRKNKIK